MRGTDGEDWTDGNPNTHITGREIESQLLPLPTEVGSSTISEVYTSEGSTDFTVEVGQGNLKLLYNANEGKLTHYINGRSLVFGPSDAVQFVHKLLKPQMCQQLGEIPRSTFQFDSNLKGRY
ncbi:hypothetical protein LOK49_LG01G00853 [Camellia lanceoleosa]|uniref:Uncharacterized protein n=1 Tax=Camellia lanceoleosa TaxID=1840588 RepID=A0ACC0IYT7_9ERIC|nr:hypothetical protein LOK49_LG01G00853 [Camellia lanceoleosa]